MILAVLALIVIGIPLVLLAVHTQYMPLDQLFGELRDRLRRTGTRPAAFGRAVGGRV